MGTAEEGLTREYAAIVGRCLDALTIDRRSTLEVIEVDGDHRVRMPCDGAVHTALVDGGRLVLLDHDVDAELAMLVFGGDVPPCLLYLVAWERATVDGFLEEWAADADGDRAAHAFDDWHGNYWESWPSEPPAARALFGPRLQRAAAIDVSRRWVASGGPLGPGSAWAAVRRAVTVRARRAFVLSLATVHAHRRPDALVPVSISVTPDGSPAIHGVLSRRSSSVELRLPVRWLCDVWARERALVDGCFVLDAGDDRVVRVEWRPSASARREHREHVPVLVE